MTRAGRGLAVATLFAALTVAMAAPWSLHPATRVLVDNPDTHLYMWTLGWDVHALTTTPWRIFDANIFHPAPNTLAYSENLIGSALLAAPILWLTGDLVLTLNLVSLLSCALCGVGTYVLARRLGLSPPSAIVAGLVFAFAPMRFFRMSQMHLNAVQWLPLGLAGLHGYLDSGRRLDLRLALACFSLQALATGHGAVFLAVAMAALVAFRLAHGAPLAPARRLRDAGLAGLAAVLPALLVSLPYRRAQTEAGLRRSLENWTVTPASYLATPSHVDGWLWSLVSDLRPNETANAFLFPGVLVLALAAVAMLPAATADAGVRRRDAAFYGLLAVLSVLLFVDGPLALWPWVYSWPGFNFIRVPSRFAIVTALALAVLAGIGVERLTARWPPRRAAWAAAAAGLLLLGEFSAHPFAGTDYRLDVPAADRWLAAQPRPFVVAEMPVPPPTRSGPYERFQTAAMLHTSVHWQPTVHGYSGIRPPWHDALAATMQGFPDDASLTALREAGVTHVIVHGGNYAPPERAAMAERVRQTPALRLAYADGDDAVYALGPAAR